MRIDEHSVYKTGIDQYLRPTTGSRMDIACIRSGHIEALAGMGFDVTGIYRLDL